MVIKFDFFQETFYRSVLYQICKSSQLEPRRYMRAACRKVLLPSSGWMNGYGYRWMLKWWGRQEGVNVRRSEDMGAITATEGGRGDMTWSWANRPVQLCKGENKQVLSALSCPLLWLDKLPQTFLCNWHIYFQPILSHPPGPSQSPWSWRSYIPDKHQN